LGEEEVWRVWLVEGTFLGGWRGVLTSSVFIVSYPLRLTVLTSLSSLKEPLAFIFFGLEERDICGKERKILGIKQSNKSLVTEFPYGKIKQSSDFW
jgi:hypothetical protein